MVEACGKGAPTLMRRQGEGNFPFFTVGPTVQLGPGLWATELTDLGLAVIIRNCPNTFLGHGFVDRLPESHFGFSSEDGTACEKTA